MLNRNTWLRKLREDRDLKQSTVAAETGISRTTLSNYESGMLPSMENAITLAQYYNTSIDYLVGLSTERSIGSADLKATFNSLDSMAAEAAPTLSDVADLAGAALLYCCSERPAGDRPIAAWRDIMRGLAECFRYAAGNDGTHLIDSANAVALAALEIVKMPAIVITNQAENHP